MAKNIACPTCGETVPIPPGAAGTVIKCESCGTPIKLVSRKKTGGAGAGPEMSGASSGMSSGAAYGDAMDDGGTWNDDPPALGECAQCGSVLADPSQLVEDRGRLICPNCAARSKVSAREDVHSYRARSDEAALEPTIGFNEPQQIVVRHGPLISMNFATIGGALAACIAIGATVWLTFNPKPTGTHDPSVKPAPVINVPPADPVHDAFQASEGENIIATVNEATALVKQNNVESLQLAQAKYQSVMDLVGQRVATDPTVSAAIAIAEQSVKDLPMRIKALQDAQSTPPAPPTEVASVPPPVAIEPTPVAPAPVPEPVVEPATTDPATKPGIFWESAEEIFETPRLLAAGLDMLRREEYARANEFFEKAMGQLPPAGARELPAEHQLAYHGRGAALIGLKDYRTADAALDRVARGTTETASLVINRAIVRYELNQINLDLLRQIASMLKEEPNVQTIVLINALLDKGSFRPEIRREAEEIRDSAIVALESKNPGKKLLNGHWVDASEYDKLVGIASLIKPVEEDVKRYEQQLQIWQYRHDAAVAAARDASAEKKAIEQWKTDLEQKRASLEALRKEIPERPADVGFKPAVPEVPAGMILPEE